MRYIDCHTHVQFAAFKDDWKEVINRAISQNIWLVNVGTQKDTSRRAVTAAHEYQDGVYATVGLHPIHTEKSYHDPQEFDTFSNSQEFENKGFTSRDEEFDYDYYKKLALDLKVVAIGECGLDYAVFARNESERLQKRAPADLFANSAFVAEATSAKEAASASAEALREGGLSPEEIRHRKEKQKTAFIKQIELAKEVKKPLMIHCRDGKKSGTGQAFDELIDILKSSAITVPFVSHSFVRDLGLAKKLLNLGSHFSFNGIVTFTNDYDEVIRYLPMDRILSETDAPYLAPVPYRGKRNEPAYVIEVVKKLAEIKNVSVEKMTEQIEDNARRVFKI
jgi:TatD DNase family protein